MKKTRLIIIISVMAFLMVLVMPMIVKADSQIPVYEDPNLITNSDVKRDVYVGNYGIVKVVDNFTIKNVGSGLKTYIQIGIPKIIQSYDYNFGEKLTSIKCFGEGEESLVIEKLPYDGSGIQKWNIYLVDPLYPEETTSYRMEMVFFDLIDYSYYDSSSGGYLMVFYSVPSSPYPIDYYELEMHRPERSASESSTGFNQSDISPWNNEIYTWYYAIDTTSHSIIECIYGSRSINIDSWGYIEVLDFYRIKNIGDVALQTFELSIPSNIINGTFKIYDLVSGLLYDEYYPDTVAKGIDANITVKWSGSSGSRSPLYKNQEASIYILYRLPLEEYVTLNGDKIRLSLDLIMNQAEWAVKDFTINVILPIGASIVTFPSTIQSVLNVGGTTTLSNHYEIITNLDAVEVNLEYYMFGNFLWSLSRPLIFVMLSIFALAAYIIIRREVQAEKIIMARPKLVPSAIIREFISLYSEKVALDLDLEKLENTYSKGKIKKRNFRIQYKIIERKLIDLDREIKELDYHFVSAGGRFKKIIESLDLYEAEKIHARDGIKNLEKRYKMTGRISSTAFQKLRDDSLKRLAKAKSNIDKIIEELRGYLV